MVLAVALAVALAVVFSFSFAFALSSAFVVAWPQVTGKQTRPSAPGQNRTRRLSLLGTYLSYLLRDGARQSS